MFQKKIYNAAQMNNAELVYYLLSEKTAIDENCFSGNKNLEMIAIPPSIKSLDDSILRWCSSLIQVSIPPTITMIGSYTFYSCTSLKMICIPSSVTSIGVSCFSDCKSLTYIEIPSSVQTIDNKAFEGRSSLNQVLLSTNLIKSINVQYFALKITILFSATEIEGHSFEGIIIKNITSISHYIFDKCLLL